MALFVPYDIYRLNLRGNADKIDARQGGSGRSGTVAIATKFAPATQLSSQRQNVFFLCRVRIYLAFIAYHFFLTRPVVLYRLL